MTKQLTHQDGPSI